MGIGRKSRKLKGKKRQTGRKIRRGTRRSRLGRMSLMKGGSADAAVEALGGVSTGCDSIKKLIDELNGKTKNLFQQQAQEAKENNATLTAENRELRQQIEALTKANEDTLERLATEHSKAVAEEREKVATLTADLTRAQANGTASAEELELIREQLAAAQVGLEKEQSENAVVSSELEDARTKAADAEAAADRAAAAVTKANQTAAAQKQQGEAKLRQISEKFKEIDAVVEKLRKSCIENIQVSLINLIENLREKKCLDRDEAAKFLARPELKRPDEVQVDPPIPEQGE